MLCGQPDLEGFAHQAGLTPQKTGATEGFGALCVGQGREAKCREPRESCMERRRRSRARKAIGMVQQMRSPAGTVCGQHLGGTAEEAQLCTGKMLISGLFGPRLSARRTVLGT